MILTDTMFLLGRGKFCTHQVVKVGKRAYGIQGHLELTPELFKEWIQKNPDLLKQDKQILRNDFSKCYKAYAAVGRIFFTNFLHLAALLPSNALTQSP